MTTSFKPSLAPVRAPGINTEIGVSYQRDLLGWRLPMPFNVRDLAGAIGEHVHPHYEQHSAALAEATLRAWIKTGRITSAGHIGGLPSYRRTS